MVYKIINETGGERKFRDSFSGKEIFLKKGESVIVKRLPLNCECFKVENVKSVENLKKKVFNGKINKDGKLSKMEE